LESAEALEARLTHEVRIRYIEGVTPKMRIIHGTRALEIVSVANDMEMDEVLVIQAKEVTT
jgi:head-tail adaptor